MMLFIFFSLTHQIETFKTYVKTTTGSQRRYICYQTSFCSESDLSDCVQWVGGEFAVANIVGAEEVQFSILLHMKMN